MVSVCLARMIELAQRDAHSARDVNVVHGPSRARVKKGDELSPSRGDERRVT